MPADTEGSSAMGDGFVTNLHLTCAPSIATHYFSHPTSEHGCCACQCLDDRELISCCRIHCDFPTRNASCATKVYNASHEGFLVVEHHAARRQGSPPGGHTADPRVLRLPPLARVRRRQLQFHGCAIEDLRNCERADARSMRDATRQSGV